MSEIKEKVVFSYSITSERSGIMANLYNKKGRKLFAAILAAVLVLAMVVPLVVAAL